MHMREMMVVQRSWSKSINFNMNILITGASSFIGRNLNRIFFEENEHNVYAKTHEELDVTDKAAVDHFFDTKEIDIVIHCAIKGGKRGTEDTFQDFVDNLSMFNNLLENKDKYKKLINFCSGAAFDRRYDINDAFSFNLYDKSAIDYYGMSKAIVARKVLKLDNAINLRLFGCFGEGEEEQRFIKNSINRSLRGESIHIIEDKDMDFFHIDDVGIVVKEYIEGKLDPIKDINLVYDKKYSLNQIAILIKELTRSDKEIIVDLHGGFNYTGNRGILEGRKSSIKSLDYWLKREVEIARQKSTDS
jgi:nucleoside-diphosphate-sugar epimerase